MNRTLWIVALLAALTVTLAWFFSDVFLYLVISVVIATALRPIVNFITSFEIASWPVPRVLGISVAYAGLVFLVVSFVLLLVPLINDQVAILRGMDVERVSQGLLEPIRSVELWLLDNELTNKEPGFLVDGMRTGIVNFVTSLDMSNLFGQVIALTGNIFIGFMAVMFITSFLLYERGVLRRGLIALIPNRFFEVFINAIHKIEKLLSNYLLGLLFQMFTIFSLASIGLSIMGVKYALTIALVAAIANVIPYLGPIIGSVFGVIIGLIPSALTGFTDDTLWLVIKICSVFAVVQVTDNVVIQPLIFSKSVKAHPLEIFVIIFVGATIGGIVGMIAAIPVYTIVRVSISELYKGSRRYRVFNMS